jgi:hypothetical protein
MADKFPRPYVDTVPKVEGGEGMMQYVPFDKMGIGARPSGLPKDGVNDIKSLTHVGEDGTSGKKTWGGK